MYSPQLDVSLLISTKDYYAITLLSFPTGLLTGIVLWDRFARLLLVYNGVRSTYKPNGTL